MKLNNKSLRLILSQFDIGAGKKGAAKGPEELLEALIRNGIVFDEVDKLSNADIPISESKHPYCKNIEELKMSSVRLSESVEQAIQNDKFPIIFSGDHSNAIGGVSGLKSAYPDKRIGVIWVDAHADLHSPYTTPSGNMHGMPLAALIADDNAESKKNNISEEEAKLWNELKSIGSGNIVPKIHPQDLVFIGLRDAEQQEWHLIDKYEIMYFGPDDIKMHGIYYAINHAVSHLEPCDMIYVSFDVDSMDPSLSTGTGTPVEEGLNATEAEAVLFTLLNHPKTAILEITEINPDLDGDGQKMSELTANLLEKSMA
jgi:arginase